MNKLMVLDGNSLVNRAFYGVSQNLTTRSGQPTNAIFGFLNILNKLLEEEDPQALCVTFDRKAPTFRHLAYEGYKAQRKGMPDELAAQLPVLKDVLAAMNMADLYFKEQDAAENLRRQIKENLEEASRLKMELSEAKREIFKLQTRK